MAQTLPVPGNYQYALSLWARSSGGSNATLTAGSTAETFSLGPQWQRISLAVNLAQSVSSITFGMQLDPGASVDLFGMQVDAQWSPSDYKKTGASGGVYTKARFATDAFTVTAQSTDVYDATIRIVSTES